MKILHTADLHLGKALHENSLIEDQRYMLNGLLALLSDPPYNALIIAGDVYDRSIPPPDALKLFSPFLGKLKRARPDIEVFLISGNHDSASRLGFGRELFAELGVHFITEPEDADKPIIVYDKEKNEKTAFFLLPFLTAGSLKATDKGERETLPLRSQSQLAKEAGARLEKARVLAVENGADYTVLTAHIFASGGLASDSERIFLGNAECTDIRLFAGFDYVALGHLHRFQKVGANAYYSGSPIAYSFSEADYEKFFLSVELEKGKTPRVEPIPVKVLRKMTRLKDDFNTLFQGDLSETAKKAASSYLEITLTNEKIIENPLPLLRGRFPYLLSVRQSEAVELRFAEHNSRVKEKLGKRAESVSEQNIADEFSDFLAEIYSDSIDFTEELALFKDLLLEIENENNR
jgi:exonuclease SbcD